MGKRIFTAIKVEDEEPLEELVLIRDRLDLGFNPVSKHKMHITLEFFQDVADKELSIIKDHLKTVSHDDFKLSVNGIGCFPSKSYIRVLWAGAEGEEIYNLYNKVSDHKISSNSKHEFKPHITLFRVSDLNKNQKKKLQKQIEEYENHRFGKINVNSFQLYESVKKKNSVEYKLIENYEL